MRWRIFAGAAAAAVTALAAGAALAQDQEVKGVIVADLRPPNSIQDYQWWMANEGLTSEQLVKRLLERIDKIDRSGAHPAQRDRDQPRRPGRGPRARRGAQGAGTCAGRCTASRC